MSEEITEVAVAVWTVMRGDEDSAHLGGLAFSAERGRALFDGQAEEIGARKVWPEGDGRLCAGADPLWVELERRVVVTSMAELVAMVAGAEDAVSAAVSVPPPAPRAEGWLDAAAECNKAGGAYAERGAVDAAGAAFALMDAFLRKAGEAEYVATPCDFVACEPGGEPCSVHERLMAHAEGDHELCAPDCGAEWLRRLAAVSGPCVAGEQQNETPEAVVARVLYVAEVIDANGIGWAADSIRRACRGDAEQPRTCAHCGQVHAASSLTHFGAPGGPWYCVDRDDCRGAGGLPPRRRASVEASE